MLFSSYPGSQSCPVIQLSDCQTSRLHTAFWQRPTCSHECGTRLPVVARQFAQDVSDASFGVNSLAGLAGLAGQPYERYLYPTLCLGHLGSLATVG